MKITLLSSITIVNAGSSLRFSSTLDTINPMGAISGNNNMGSLLAGASHYRSWKSNKRTHENKVRDRMLKLQAEENNKALGTIMKQAQEHALAETGSTAPQMTADQAAAAVSYLEQNQKQEQIASQIAAGQAAQQQSGGVQQQQHSGVSQQMGQQQMQQLMQQQQQQQQMGQQQQQQASASNMQQSATQSQGQSQEVAQQQVSSNSAQQQMNPGAQQQQQLQQSNGGEVGSPVVNLQQQAQNANLDPVAAAQQQYAAQAQAATAGSPMSGMGGFMNAMGGIMR